MPDETTRQTYAQAGVDIQRAERFVERLKRMSRRPAHDELWPGAGGYASVYPVGNDQGIALTTDGVGTKLLVAHKLERYDTIGIDLVAMCANDLICVGARPSLFLDYLAAGKLEDKVADAIIEGIVAACDQTGMILAGGETAEMPGVYDHGHYDLAGFAVGQVSRARLITGERIRPGQTLVGVASTGIHSNGLSLARQVLKDNHALWENLLVPTRLYVKPVNAILDRHGDSIAGMAHITGGGWTNLFRLNAGVGFHIDSPLPIPDILLSVGAHVGEAEMYRTFNMGMGLGVIVDGDPAPIIKTFQDCAQTAQVVGRVTDRPGQLTIEGSAVSLTG